MNQRNRTILMWAFFALIYLLVMLVQTTLFGRVRLLGVKLNLMPIVIVCIAMHVGHESGGLFGLIAGFFWYAAGADDGALAMVTYTVFGILAGWLCDTILRRRYLPAVTLSLAALALHEGSRFLLKFYLGGADRRLIIWVPVITCLSLLTSPVIYLLVKAARKVGMPT